MLAKSPGRNFLLSRLLSFQKPIRTLMVSLLVILTASAPNLSLAKEGGKQRVVNLAIWGNYFDEAEQKRFSKLTGIKLNITNYASNEDLLAKIQSGASGLDIAVPSDYMVAVLIKLKMLEPLQKSLIPNASDLDPQFLRQDFDPENAYSLPYAWSTTGFAIQRDLFKGQMKGWKDLLAERGLDGKVSLLDDVRECLAVAAKIGGFNVNTVSKPDLDQMKQSLLELRKMTKMFRSDTVDALTRKEIAIAHTYSTDALQAWKKSKGKIEYVLPIEGGTWAIDNTVILRGAKNVREAHELINFFLDTQSNVVFVKNILAGPVLKKTRALLPDDLKNLPGLFPSADRFAKLERLHDIGEATRAYDRIWTEIKSQ